MANSLKELMRLTKDELSGIGSQFGLTFHSGMRKADMVQQLQASAASGWMEANQELLYSNPADEFDNTIHFGNAGMLSDAAQVAHMLTSSGYTETFNNAVAGGTQRHLAELQGYMEQLGVNVADVSLHMPHSNPYETPKRFGAMGMYIRNSLIGHGDIMPEMAGHYAGDIMAEYATNQGDVYSSYEHLAHMYLDQSKYASPVMYERDVANVASRLASHMGSGFHEVAASSAMGAHVSYTSLLPQMGSSVVGGALHPREALNAAGLPLGSVGSAVGSGEFSFAASVTGSPSWSPASQAVYGEAASTMRSLAQVYRGESGINARRHVTSDYDRLLDTAARYGDEDSARAGYENLKASLGTDSIEASAANLQFMLDNPNRFEEAPDLLRGTGASNFAKSGYLRGAHTATGTGFTATFDSPMNFNVARDRAEAKRIADYDSIPFRNVEDYGTSKFRNQSNVTYHDDLVQGSDEWLAFREGYDITGSTIGSYLGNNAYTRPWKEMTNKLGLNNSGGSSAFQQKMFAAGHKTEDEARIRVAAELGQSIQQTGAITNSQYPSMMYSPDGLIGDDALWEHKNPERAGKFADLNAGDHPDYMDQVQLGMLVSGRSRTLFSQTIGQETRSQWIDRDSGWFERNQDKINSTLGRLDAGRAFIREHVDLPPEELTKGARAAMQGEGIWKDVSQRSNRGYSALAGTSEDPFATSRSAYSELGSPSNYVPNFVMSDGTPEGQTGGVAVLSEAVKTGILSAQEENRRRGSGSAGEGGGGSGGGRGRGPMDADFADDYDRDEVGKWFNQRGGSGGGGGPTRQRPWSEYGDAGSPIAQGIAGGSTSSFGSGVRTAMELTPWGRAASLAIGAGQIGAEIIESQNDYYGAGLDAGMDNPIEFASMSQGLEVLGLNSAQASSVNQTTHSAYNTLLNGDPSAAVRLVKGTRGLITIGDIRASEGDPVALARVIQERGRERGWSQARVAGAMQMAGLGGMARAYGRGEFATDRASELVQSGADADYSGVAGLESAQASRATLLPSYALQQAGIEYGGESYSQGSTAMEMARGTAKAVGAVSNDAWHGFIAQAESGGNALAQSATSTAQGLMQVLNGTARDPGFGVQPARDNSPEERARVGRDYADAMLRRYGGDYDKANAAYTEGPGTIDKLIDAFGSEWLKHAPDQARKRVAAFHDTFGSNNSLQAGAGSFTSSAATPTMIQVNIQAQVNQQSASANVTATGGQTTSQTINMGNGAMQKR